MGLMDESYPSVRLSVTKRKKEEQKKMEGGRFEKKSERFSNSRMG